MKIVIDGTESTGKTTLVNALSNRLADYTVITEAVRDFAKNVGIVTKHDLLALRKDVDRYADFARKLFEYQHELESVAGKLLIDGSLFRIAAYTHVNGKQLPEFLIKKASYDIILFCPIEFERVEDGFRHGEDRIPVERQLHAYYGRFSSAKIFEVRGDLETRVATSLRILGANISESHSKSVSHT